MTSQAVSSENAAQSTMKAVDVESFVDLLGASTVTERLDTGSALILKVNHPQRGALILVNQAAGSNVVIQC